MKTMKTKFSLISYAALLLLATLNVQLSTFAQGTAFTYQGRLNDGVAPVTGLYDLRFAIYDAATVGAQQGNLLTNSATGVSNGLFTVTLDFGSQFPGADRWLEIAVRTNGPGSFFTLAPRQALTPAPYAITAGNVVSGGLATGTYGNAVTLSNAANQFSGAFTGNGANITNVNAASLGGLASSNFWQKGGNNVAPGQFLGSTNNQPVELRASNQRALRLELNADSPNVIGGSSINTVGPGAQGATIAGGGSVATYGAQFPNRADAYHAAIGGGLGNWIQLNAQESTIAGGNQNQIQNGANDAVIAGGVANVIQTNAYKSAIGGGEQNIIASDAVYATIAGGAGNYASRNQAVVSGGYVNTAIGSGATVGGGAFNKVSSDYGTIAGGYQNSSATNAAYATIGGGSNNLIRAGNIGSSILGGWANQTSNNFASVVGGAGNIASGSFSTASGFSSVASGSQATAMGSASATGPNSTAFGVSAATGDTSSAMGNSKAQGAYSVALGNTIASGPYSTASGLMSLASGNEATALGSASASGDFSTALGNSGAAGKFSTAAGTSTASGRAATAMGSSTASGTNSTALGLSTATGFGATAIGAFANATADYATALGQSSATNVNATAAGQSTAGGNSSTALGASTATGDYTTALGQSTASGIGATAMGGSTASGNSSTAMGSSTAQGTYSTAAGYVCNASGVFSFAAGKNAHAAHDGTFVWGDSQGFQFSSTGSDQFCVRAQGGVQLDPTTSIYCGNQTRQMLNLWSTGYGIGVQNNTEYFRSAGGYAWYLGGVHNDNQNNAGGGSTLMKLDNSGLTVNGTFVSSSDRNVKTGITPVDARAILDKVAAMPVTRWQYTNDLATAHVGPMAQDFYAAFNVGPDDKHITTIDESGVALAAIQGLNQKVENQLKAKDLEIQQLKESVAQLKAMVSQLAKTQTR